MIVSDPISFSIPPPAPSLAKEESELLSLTVVWVSVSLPVVNAPTVCGRERARAAWAGGPPGDGMRVVGATLLRVMTLLAIVTVAPGSRRCRS
jgi:hypothetical protein